MDADKENVKEFTRKGEIEQQQGTSYEERKKGKNEANPNGFCSRKLISLICEGNGCAQVYFNASSFSDEEQNDKQLKPNIFELLGGYEIIKHQNTSYYNDKINNSFSNIDFSQ